MPELRLGLIINKAFHQENRWVSATTYYLIEEFKKRFACIWIENQKDYEDSLGDLDLLISMEPGWASPALELSKTPALREKLAHIPSYVFYSDPHANQWRQDYFLANGLDYVLAFYYAPTRYHFRKISPKRLVHFPWAIPVHWVSDSPICFRGQSKICCFGASKSEAYAVRNWCRTFGFVESSDNSGVENKAMTDAEYIRWLSHKDAAIAAGSDSVKYRLTVPKYFEIPAVGSLLFAQHTEDLQLLGFKHMENCVVFNRSNFEKLSKEYLARPEDYLKIREAGRELIRQRHTLSRRMSFLQRHIFMALRQKAERCRFLPSASNYPSESVSTRTEPSKSMHIPYEVSGPDQFGSNSASQIRDDQITGLFEAWFSRICIESILNRARTSLLSWEGRLLEWEVNHEIMAYHEFSGGRFSFEELIRLSNHRYELLDKIWPGDSLTKDTLQKFYIESAKILPWGHGVFVADHNVAQRRRNWLRRVKLIEVLKSLGVHSVVDYGAGGGHTTLLAKAMGFSRVVHHEYDVFNPYVLWRAGFIDASISGSDDQQFEVSDAALPLHLSDPVHAVLCTDVAEHVWDPDSMLEEIREALTPRGMLVWSAMFGEGIACHLHSHLRGREEELLEQYGFERLSELPGNYPGHSGLYRLKARKSNSASVPSVRHEEALKNEQIIAASPATIGADLNRNQWLSPPELSEIQWKRLKMLLAHAYKNVPFYRRRFDEMGLGPTDIHSIDDFRKIPILKKTDIQQKLDVMKASNYPAGQLIRDATGGSTGQPLTFFRDQQANVWLAEAAERFRQWIGYGPRNKLAFIWGADRDVPLLYPSNQRWLNSFNCSAEEIEAFVKELVEWKPDAIRAYASSLYLVASYIKQKKLRAPRPKAIESAAEKLWDQQRGLVEDVFGCKVFEVYGSREIPSLACECEVHKGLHVFSDIRLVEVVKDGWPAPPGKEGSLIITDLVNYGMPFIRYEIGDVGIWSEETCSCGRPFPLLKEIKGRVTSTIHTPDGRLIHGEYFTHLFYNVTGVEAFQVRQKGLYEVEVAVQRSPGFDSTSIEGLIAQMQDHLGPQVSVQWKVVNEIPPAPSGKRHFTISDVSIDFTSRPSDNKTPSKDPVAKSTTACDSTRKPRILFIVDSPNWAHDFKTDNIMRVLGHSYDMYKSYKTDVRAEQIDAADLVVVFYWKEFNDPNMKGLFDVFRQNRQKLLLGICSHCEMEGDDREKGLTLLKSLAAAVFTNSPLLYGEFASVFEVPIFCTPNGVDTEFFTPGGDKEISNTLCVGWAGSLSNHKEVRGYFDFIMPAIASMDCVELITAARENKWRDREQMRQFYRSLDVYICASRAEGTPNTCLEAAACGVPLLTTRVGNMPELVEHGVNGFFIERSVEDIVSKLVLLRDNVQLRVALSQSILDSIQDWDWRHQAQNYRQMFDTILQAKTIESPRLRSVLGTTQQSKTKDYIQAAGEDQKPEVCVISNKANEAVVEVNGLRIFLNPEKYLDQTLLDGRLWEQAEVNLLSRLIKPGMTVLDVGANFGYYTLLFSKWVGETGRVIAFEPTREYSDRLFRHVQENGLKNVRLEMKGLSNCAATRRISIGECSGTLHWIESQPPRAFETVQLITLDQWWEQYIAEGNPNRVDFIKVDIDGHEPNFLLGARNVLLRHRPLVLMEFFKPQYANAGYSCEGVVDFLEKELGYVLCKVSDGRPFDTREQLLERIDDDKLSCDVLCVPREKLPSQEKNKMLPVKVNRNEPTPQLSALDYFLKAREELFRENFATAVEYMKKYRSTIDYSRFPRILNKTGRSSNIDISVIIVTYNRTEDLKKCLESLSIQDEANFEVVVVDNGGSDLEVFGQYVDQYIRCPINFVLSEGRNIGAWCAKGKIISFLDDDALVPANYISSIKAAFKTYEIFGLRGKALPKSNPEVNKDAVGYDRGDKPFVTFCDLEGNSAFLRDVYLSLNGMDPLLFGHEGSDLTYRIIKKHAVFNKIIYWPDTLIYHDAATDDSKREKRNRYKLLAKYLNFKHNSNIFGIRSEIEKHRLPGTEQPVPEGPRLHHTEKRPQGSTVGSEMVPQNSVKPAPTQLYKNSQNREEFLPLMTVKNNKKSHYGKEYFDWQKNIGSFGGLANLFKFKEFINITDTVIDFGCGGGYLLRNLQCKEKMGIEVNPHARQEAKRNGIKVVESADEVPDKFADIIISNHALEHVGNPLEVLKKLRKKLKNNGKIIFVVPHQNTREEYDSADKNKHLYTWNQMTLGNLFSEAGYEVLKAKAFQHQWPPNYIEVCSQYGEEEFHKRCREYAIKNNNYQIRIVATKNSRIRNYVTKDIPVILVCYNRPKHTLEVLKALKEHSIKNIYIFSDAPKRPEDAEAVSLVRRLVHSIYWTKPRIVERAENLGLARNIVSAVGHVFEQYDRLILLEDDCVPQRYFFDFMNACLEKYESNPKVFGISGHTVQVPDQVLHDYPYDLYFCPRIGSWGWATWKRAWQHYKSNLRELVQTANEKGIDLTQGGKDIPISIENFLKGQLQDVWTLNWVLSVYIENGVYVYPTRSHIKNIGTDGTGLHCGRTDKFDSLCSQAKPTRYPTDVFLDDRITENFLNYFQASHERSSQAGSFLKSLRSERPLKIAQINTVDNRGGAAKVAWMLKQGLSSRGHRVKMFVKNKYSGDPDVTIITNPAIDGRGGHANKGLLYYDINSTFSLPRNTDFIYSDIFHFHNLHGAYFNSFVLPDLARMRPSVWTLHDMQSFTGHCAHSFECDKWKTGCGNCPDLSIYPALPRDTTARLWKDKKQIYESADITIVVPSQWLKLKVKESILKDKRVELIYNGVDTKVFRPYPKQASRKQLGLPKEATILAFAAQGGVNSPWRDSKCLVDTIEHLGRNRGPVYFLSIGSGAKVLQTGNIIHIPYVKDEKTLALIYSAADLFLFPSLADNCPLVVIESMACGLPVVAYSTGGIPEITENGRTGAITEYGNKGEFVRAVEYLAFDHTKKEQYSRAGIERAKQVFSLELMLERYLALYHELIENTSKQNYVSPGNRVALPKVSVADRKGYLVSAIVSTYNSEKFIHGCLEDLENQTIADRLEIIVVDSGSRENEEAIVREYQQRHNNIVYIKTEQREGIYTAWNRAVKVARGVFLTNANTDDRHREDALEKMAETLLANPDVALVYADQIRTDTPNGTFARHHAIEMARRPEYSRERLLFGCCVGSQPMWRKSLHDEFGYFDDTLTCAGDWDFWLRISSKYKFKHTPEFLGLYYYNENGIEHGRKIHSLYERYIVGKRYGNPYISVIPLYKSRNNPLVSIIMPAYNAAEHIAEAIESVLIQNYRNFELIVVDDGSTDDTKNIVASFKDDKIKYFYKNNCGPSSARNLAISKAKGQYIMPLDSDDMMTPDFIAKHLAEFEKHPEADLIYCDVLLIDGSSNPIRIMNKLEYQDRRHLIRDLFRAGHPIVPFRLGIRRSVFDKIGLYDEGLLIAEDYDMMRRFVKAGLKAHHLSEPLHIRRIHADSLSKKYSTQKATCHFDVVGRFIETFAYDELFPDVAWDEIAPEMRQLHAKCLAAGTYLAIGQEYIKTNATGYASTAFDRACSELNDCLKMIPENQRLRQLLQKTELLRARYSKTVQQAVS